MDIQVGKFVAIYSNSRCNRPEPGCLRVEAMGKRIMLRRIGVSYGRRVFASDVLAVFDTQAEGDLICEVAAEVWTKQQKAVESAEANRDAAVLGALRSKI